MSVVEMFLDAADLAEDIAGAETASDVPKLVPPSTGNWLAITVVNHTQFVLIPADSYFDSGRMDVGPSDVGPFKAITFSVSVPDVSVFTGVTGAITFTFNPLPNLVCRFGVGFSNPAIGTYKSNVGFDANNTQPNNAPPLLSPISVFTQDVYDGNAPGVTSATSATFTGSDANGQPIAVNFVGSASSGEIVVASIVQTIVSGGG